MKPKLPTYRQLMDAAKRGATELNALFDTLTPEQVDAITDRFIAGIVAVERKLSERGWISPEDIDAIRAKILPDPADAATRTTRHPYDDELCIHELRRADCPLCEAFYNTIEADPPAGEA